MTTKKRTVADSAANPTPAPATPRARVRPGASKAAAPVAQKAPVEALSAPESDEEPRPVKYTANLDHDTVDAFDAITRAARRRLGRHVDKSSVFRQLILLAADDASLRDQLINALRDST